MWKNTDSVLKWFNNITSKKDYNFIAFDVVEFYPSINNELMNKALDFAARFSDISQMDRNIICHVKKSTLIDEKQHWAKKKTTNLFDVTMGSFDGAETCELVGLYLLHQIKEQCGHNFGLYRDDGLGVIKATNRQTETIKKKLCKIFANFGLKLTIDVNRKVVDFLDVTLDLIQETYQPYIKPNNKSTYVHKNSNHPPAITRNIPQAVNRRLRSISSNNDVFERSIRTYQQALKESGYDHKLTYEQTTTNQEKRKGENGI